MRTTLTYEYWRDGRWYVAQLREVPSVLSQGRTLAELERNLRDAYRLILTAGRGRGYRVRRRFHRRRLTVEAALKTIEDAKKFVK